MSFGQQAEFCFEDITFNLDGNYFGVEGHYWFANNNKETIKAEIFYPFPNAKEEKIDSIKVIDISKLKEIRYRSEREQGISFPLVIKAKDTLLIKISYRQKLNSDSAVYILRSTRMWKKPLSKAEYKLIIPGSFQVETFSYAPDKLFNVESKKIYYWKKCNFMPNDDMVFHFKK